MITAIFLGIAIFMFLVIIHELGHFRTARKFGVKVQEFGVGIPPKITTLTTDKKGTAFTLNWIPLGGFVRLKGEDPADPTEFLAPDSFISASLKGKLIILFGGIIANIIFARIAFSMSFFQGIRPISILPDTAIPFESTSYLIPSSSFLIREGFLDDQEMSTLSPTINQILPESRADRAGLQIGDEITHIDETPITEQNLVSSLQEQFGRSFSLRYIRDGNSQTTNIECPESECLLGISIHTESYQNDVMITFGFWDAWKAGAKEIHAQTIMSFRALGRVGAGLFSFNKEKVTESTRSLSGPVGIIKMIEVITLRGGGRQLLAFAGMISLALAIFNILPIPALDGGRAVSVIIQAIGGRKPTSYFKIEGWLNMIFFVLLMGLGIIIIFKDLHMARGVSLPFIG